MFTNRRLTDLHILIAGQGLLCMLAAYLISKISLLGKIGIALFYKEYKLLRSGWKTFLLFYAIQLLIILVLYITQKKTSKPTVLTASIIIMLSVVGMVLTFVDFQYTYSHRLLKERFHLGFYLFWIGWILSCVYFIIKARKSPAASLPSNDYFRESL